LEELLMHNSRMLMPFLAVAFVVLGTFTMPWSSLAFAGDDAPYKTVGGLAVYLGVVPAEIVKGHQAGHAEQTMHGGPPTGRHEHHVVVAVFEAASGVRVSDATVTAQISGLGLAGTKKKLEPMEIANTITYGGFFGLPGADLYAVRLAIQRAGTDRTWMVDFNYDHRNE
jgi:hypothetical protein